MTGAKIRSLLVKKSFACALALLSIEEDYRRGLFGSYAVYECTKQYWKGRHDAYKQLLSEVKIKTREQKVIEEMEQWLALLDNANTIHSC